MSPIATSCGSDPQDCIESERYNLNNKFHPNYEFKFKEYSDCTIDSELVIPRFRARIRQIRQWLPVEQQRLRWDL